MENFSRENLGNFSNCLLEFLQEELSKTDQEVMRCKHHKKHYDEKRSAHLRSIQTLENNVAGKDKELQVGLGRTFYWHQKQSNS